MVKSRRKQVTARISSTSAYQFGLLRIRVLAVTVSASYQAKKRLSWRFLLLSAVISTIRFAIGLDALEPR